MAHAATISALVSGLVASITGLESTAKDFGSARDSAIKSIRSQNHARVNQFLVKERLDGLVEKFAVFNRDDLSDALEARLVEVDSREKWIPDILALFLELSDRPAQNSKVEDISASQEPVKESELTWDEIVADDPLNEPDIWDDIERGYHSSADEDYDDGESDPTVSTQASSLTEDNATSAARLLLVRPDEQLLQPLRDSAQLWRSAKRRNEPLILPELVVIQEIISMMHGLPTSLFSMDDRTNEITLDRKVTLESVSTGALSSLLSECMDVGSSLNLLRYSMAVPQKIAFLQSIQSSVRGLLTGLSSRLGELEQTFIALSHDTTVSCLDVIHRINALAKPLERISRLFQQCSTDQFAVLDVLYEECCITQITDDQPVHQAVVTVFLAGLETYLRSVAAWLDTGMVLTRDKEISLVSDADSNCDPGKFWQSRFALRTKEDGGPFAPKCLQHLVDKLFALGKAKSFLHRLDHSAEDFDATAVPIKPPTTLQTIFKGSASATVIPFDQSLADALLRWIAVSSTDCTPTLRVSLLNEHGLSQTLKAMPYVFFSRDSSLFSSFSELITDRLRSAPDGPAWSDCFILTELASTTLGQARLVDTRNLYVTLTEPSSEIQVASPIRALSSFQVEYRFSWPIQNVTRMFSSTTHSRVLTLLLQVSYSEHILNSPFFSLRDPSSLRRVSDLRLRHRLRTFLNSLAGHVTSSASALHSEMEASIQAATDVDAMIRVWQTYDVNLQGSMFLSPKLAPLYDAILTILGICEGLTPLIEQLAINDLERRYDETLHFLVPGIRGVSRVGAGVGLDSLAERLEWDMRT